ncbi:hypothetical protein F2Q70_00042289 [Brassica cretica]|uniref:Uncharacterized protein n=1 Tax=Brassica cretica TaxID=69181 RepID=A0A8S9KHE6_BRACR|nr:hypothetical protein F2Q70_00042289 [Brassica cretica]
MRLHRETKLILVTRHQHRSTTSTLIYITTSTSIDMDSYCRSTSLEIPETCKDSEQKLDDNHHTSGRDMETSPKASIDHHPPESIDRHPPDCIDRHPLDDIDQHPRLDELPGYIVELKPIEESMYKFEDTHLAVPTHMRPPICAEEAAWFHKRLKRLHDPVKFVVPCAIFEVE